MPTRDGPVEQRIETTREQGSQTADQAKQKVAQVADQAKQRAGQAREKAGQLKMTLADKLDAGAGKLRHKTAGELESPTERDGTTRQAAQRMDKMSGAMANGMEGTAHWLRTTDLDSLRGDVEKQVRTNPGRSLLVALGLGYVLARMFRGGGSEG